MPGLLPGNIAKSAYKFDAERSPLAVILLFVSLGLIIVGNGYFKPNISTIVGSLYAPGDRRKDTGFTIFYMGINLGSIFSQWFAPLIAIAYGYNWGFALCGVGMLFAWARIQFSGKQLTAFGNPPAGAKNRQAIIVFCSFLAIPVVWFLLNNAMLAASIAQSASSTGIVGYMASQPLLGQIMFAVFVLALIGIPAWASFSERAWNATA